MPEQELLVLALEQELLVLAPEQELLVLALEQELQEGSEQWQSLLLVLE